MAEERLAVDGAELHVDVLGNGRPIVLIHGLGLSGALWDRVCAAFAPGYRLVRVDLRGAPRSREDERGELSLARWADDLGAVLDRLEVDDAVLVGHSLGASVALKYALEQPGRVRGAVLIGTEAISRTSLLGCSLGRADREHGHGGLDRRVLVAEPAFL